MSGLVCGIDIGSTNLKVLLLDDYGRTAWVKSVATPKRDDGLGPVTDARAIVQVLEGLILEGWRATARGKPLAAIATSGIGEDGVGVDAGLRPLGEALSWFDKRGERDAAEIGRLPAARRHPGIRFDFCMTAGKWRWLRRERPGDLEGARHWITITDFPSVAWSGTPYMSETLAPRTGCYDVFTREWIPDLLAASDAPPLPPLKKAGQIIGTMRRGQLTSAGAASTATLLVTAGHDHPMAASAIRRIQKDARIDSLGTANATYGETAMPRPGTAESGLDLTVPATGGPGVALIGPIEFSMALHQAVADHEIIRRILAEPHIAGHPARLPPADLPAGDAALRLRLTLEMLTLRARGTFEAMTRAGVPSAPIYTTGGWAKSLALVELRASLFGEPVTIIDEPELVSLSAALFAAEAAFGQAPDFARHHLLSTVEPRRDWMDIYAAWPDG